MQDVKTILGLVDQLFSGRKFGAAVSLGQFAELAAFQHIQVELKPLDDVEAE
ncbi:hypothetical protein D3C72_2347030 [compost metagenome]